MKIVLASCLWTVALILAIGNGYISNAYVEPQFGDYTGHVYKSLILITVIFLLARVYASRTEGTGWFSSAIKTGLLWFGLTVIFELFYGHYIIDASWDTLLSDYRIWEGRLWSLVLLSELVAPTLMGLLIN